MTTLIIIVGILVLVGLAVAIGASLDTDAQRVEWREVARERKERNSELRALQDERERLQDERRAFRNQSQGLCADCPFRDDAKPPNDGSGT